MSYNLHFDSLASYRLLERKSFSIRTLNLLSVSMHPGSLSDDSLVLVPFVLFVPIQEHPSSTDAVPFSCFSPPLLSSRPPCPYPPSCSLLPPPPHFLAPLLACCHSLAEPQFWSIPSPVKESPLWQGYESENHQRLQTSALVGAARGLVNVQSCVTVVPSWGSRHRRASHPHR